MDWLPTLLKHLSIARAAVLAFFVTSAVLYAGPKFAPNYVDPLPKEYSAIIVGIFVFSTCILMIWLFAYIWEKIKAAGSTVIKKILAIRLTSCEKSLLLMMAERPTELFHLEEVNFQISPYTHLELLQVARNLKRMGLANVNPVHEDLVSLTEEGQMRALELQRQNSVNL
jgi:hypothetical protein